jgi:hypothetical protein
MDQDREHLRLLSIFHYVVGAIMGLAGCFPFIHLSVGIAIVTGGMNVEGEGPPEAFGWMFILIAAFIIIFMWGIAIAILIAGQKLAAHTGHTFCLVVAGLECMFMPMGTVLGVFTIIVLVRPSVKELFGVAHSGG